MTEIKVIEETLPLDALPRNDANTNTVFVYLTPSKQFAKAGPGLYEPWTCPLLQNLTNAELLKLKLEMARAYPSVQALRVIKGPAGVGLFGMFTDASYVAQKPNVDLTDEQRVLWMILRDQSFGSPDKPDCSMDCKGYHKLEGKLGIDWGVCFDEKSPRAGLLVFRHQGCSHYEKTTPPEIPAETPTVVGTETSAETPKSKKNHHRAKKPSPPAAT
jgi:hypothetical protein